MPKYITEYVKEHYGVLRLRKEVIEKVKELAKATGLTINEAVLHAASYLLTNIQKGTSSNVVDRIASEVAKHVLDNYGKGNVKLFRYPGGDYYIFKDLNEIFMRAKAEVFVEPFGGSCWCSLNVSRSKFRVIVCNDIDKDLINFYRLVKERPCELIKRLAILPFSRELRGIAMEILSDKTADPVTKAVMLFYTTRTTFWGAPGKGGFAITKSDSGKVEKAYASAVASIAEYAKKFRDVTLECRDFREIIKLYDTEKTLFYLDPPYVGRDYYRYGFTIADLRDMARLLRSIKGYWVLKITKDNYELIKDLLPLHELGEIKTSQAMKKVEDEERPKLKYLIAHNVKAPRMAPLFR